MPEDHQSAGAGFRQEQVEPVAGGIAIGEVDFCASLRSQLLAEALCRLHPRRRPAVATGYMRAIGVGVAPILDVAAQHGRFSGLAVSVQKALRRAAKSIPAAIIVAEKL